MRLSGLGPAQVDGYPSWRKEIQMAKSTRRALLRDGGLAVGAAAFVSLNLPEVARAESESASIFHVFAFQWKQGTLEAQKDRAAKEIAAFQGLIPDFFKPMWAQIFRREEKAIVLAASCDSRTKNPLTRMFNIRRIKRSWHGSYR
jgi:hypothetical protein